MKKKSDYIFGLHATIEAVNSGKEIEKIFIKKGLKGELFRELLALTKKFHIPFQFVPIEKLNRITTKNHQGIIAYVSPIIYHSIEEVLALTYEEGKTPLILILDRITDVRNFGAIARSAECAQVDAIIIPDKGAAQINSDAIQTSAGALHTIPISRSSDLKKTIKYNKILPNCIDYGVCFFIPAKLQDYSRQPFGFWKESLFSFLCGRHGRHYCGRERRHLPINRQCR